MSKEHLKLGLTSFKFSEITYITCINIIYQYYIEFNVCTSVI